MFSAISLTIKIRMCPQTISQYFYTSHYTCSFSKKSH